MVRILVAVAVITGAVSGHAAQIDVLAALGTNLGEARDSIFLSFATGVASLPGNRQAFLAATPEQRAMMVRAVVAIARTFAGSEEFARRYALYRESQKPQKSTAPRSGDEARANQQAAIELAVKQATAGAAQMPPDARARLEESIAEMRRQIAELNADASYRAQVDDAAAAAAREDEVALARHLAVFSSEFPERVETLIARRLRQFLLTCSDVDFAAKVESASGSTVRFVNAAYERRSAEWKMCFRAGKPAVDAARRAAEEWLKGLTERGF